jgi:Omp85 superfamily domain
MRRFPFASVTLSVALASSAVFAADDPKAPVPVPERQGFFKRTFHAIMNDDKDPHARGFGWGPFEPRAEIVSSGAGPAPVLHLWAPNLVGSGLDFHAAGAYSIYSYQYYSAQLGRVPYVGRRLPRTGKGTTDLFPLADLEKTAAVPGFHAYVSARYRDYPREDFYGVGPNSLPANRTDYRLKDELYEGVVQARMSRLSLMGRAGLMRPRVRPGKDSSFPNTELSNTEETAPGLTATSDFTHLSAAAWLDLRDQPSNPQRGLSLGLAVSRFDDRQAAAYEFTRVVVDAREYIPLGSPRHVIALRQVAFLDTPDAGSEVPFYLQPNFGGSTFLRGFGATRFRDNKLLAVGAEYRLGLHKNIQFALIYEAGAVAPTMHEFNMNRLKHDYGAGIRLKTVKRIVARLDVLHSSERTRVDFKLGPSF